MDTVRTESGSQKSIGWHYPEPELGLVEFVLRAYHHLLVHTFNVFSIRTVFCCKHPNCNDTCH